MPISEGLQYSIIFWTALATTALSFILRGEDSLRIVLKVASAICWFMLALSSFAYGDLTVALTLPSVYLFAGLGIVLLFATVLDWRGDKRDSWAKGLEE